MKHLLRVPQELFGSFFIVLGAVLIIPLGIAIHDLGAWLVGAPSAEEIANEEE